MKIGLADGAVAKWRASIKAAGARRSDVVPSAPAFSPMVFVLKKLEGM
jgi:hypothetical protein